MDLREPQERLKNMAIIELNSSEGGFGGYLVDDNLIFYGNTMLVISAILSRYYPNEKNQDEIDDFMKRCLKVFSSGFGAISSTYALNELLDEMENLLVKFKE